MEFLPLVALVVVFYLLIIRPSRARQREMVALRAALAPGQEVVTASGLYATVVELDDEVVVLEAAPGVRTRWASGAVARIITPLETDSDAEKDSSEAAGADAAEADGGDRSIALPDTQARS